MTSMSDLIVADLTIKQDSEGRYCLNDLHRAAGGEAKQKPALWIRQAGDAIEAAGKGTDSYPLATVLGRTGGTFVSKRLVYSYAMWISADFQMKVIDAYDQLQTQGIAVADHAAEDLLANPMAYMERVFEQMSVEQYMSTYVIMCSFNYTLRIHT